MDIVAIEALASTASSAVVTAAATDLFEGVRHRVARLFGRGQADLSAGQRLGLTRDRLVRADPGAVEAVRAAQVAQWQTRFIDLLTDHPDAEAGLRALVEDLRGQLPGVVAASDHAMAAGRDVKVRASSGGLAAGVVHGDVAAPDPSAPGSDGG